MPTKISKTDQYAIKWLSHTGMSPSEISKELKISEEKIMQSLEKGQPVNEDKIPSGSEKAKQKSKSLLINQTAVKKTNSVSIMTEAASQKSDEARRNAKVRNNNKNIYRPNNG